MKLTKETIEILKNFSQINKEFLFKEGSKISIGNRNKSFVAEAEIKEYFPMRAGVIDLKKILLCADALGPDVEFNFSEKSLTLSNKKSEAIFSLVNEKEIEIMSNEINFDPSGIQFDIVQNTLKDLRKYTYLMRSDSIRSKFSSGLGNMYLIGTGGCIRLESRKTFSNNNEKLIINLNENCDRNFSMYVDFEKLKMIQDDFRCEIGSKPIVRFQAKNKPIKYYAAANNFEIDELIAER